MILTPEKTPSQRNPLPGTSGVTAAKRRQGSREILPQGLSGLGGRAPCKIYP